MRNHEKMSSQAFHAFAEDYIEGLSAAEILGVPGVTELVLEDYNNVIIDEIDMLEPDEVALYEERGQELLESKPEQLSAEERHANRIRDAEL
jgi:hypothetical protein